MVCKIMACEICRGDEIWLTEGHVYYVLSATYHPNMYSDFLDSGMVRLMLRNAENSEIEASYPADFILTGKLNVVVAA